MKAWLTSVDQDGFIELLKSVDLCFPGDYGALPSKFNFSLHFGIKVRTFWSMFFRVKV